MKVKRQSNRPDRRIQSANALGKDELTRIADTAKYRGLAYHKLHPGDYGLHPPASPRPSKSVCDDRRVILKAEAVDLLHQGILKGMISRPRPGGVPKYVWMVDTNNDVYEAKTGTDGREILYHGYRLSDDDQEMRQYVLDEWKAR